MAIAATDRPPSEMADLGERFGRTFGAPVAVATTERLQGGDHRSTRYERSRWHVVLVPISGEGAHEVDFEALSVVEGTVVHVLPGQVQRFQPSPALQAYVVVISPDVCPPGLFTPSEPSPSLALGEAMAVVRAVAHDLAAEQSRPDASSEVMVAGAELILRHLHRSIERSVPPGSNGHIDLVRAFRREVEVRFAECRSVSDYARTIGTSTKTLARATTRLSGLAPKEIIDQRVALEAKRLLAFTDDPIGVVGNALGFSEPTNFTKFFVRMTGQTPADFRL